MSKICHLTTVHHRYDTRIFIKECRSLCKEGYDVSLIVADGRGDEVKDGVRIRDIGKPESRIERLLRFRKKILQEALKLQADLYHFHDPELLGVGRTLARKGFKVIYDAHEDVPRQLLTKAYLPSFLRKPVSKVFEQYENGVVKKLKGIVGATPLIRDRFKAFNHRSVEVQNFPFLEEFDNNVSGANTPKEHAVCYVGAISKVRGILNMIKAFEFTEDVEFFLGGKFESEQLRQECYQLKGWERVDELGFLNREQVQSTLKKSVAGLVVLEPTINYLDSIPVKMFEYMAAGIPIIASDFPYWRSLLDGVDCAIFVDPENPRDIAEAVMKYVSDKEKANKMGIIGRRAIESKFNWDTEKAKLLQIYDAILRN